jgi:hypothetical protein
MRPSERPVPGFFVPCANWSANHMSRSGPATSPEGPLLCDVVMGNSVIFGGASGLHGFARDGVSLQVDFGGTTTGGAGVGGTGVGGTRFGAGGSAGVVTTGVLSSLPLANTTIPTATATTPSPAAT